MTHTYTFAMATVTGIVLMPFVAGATPISRMHASGVITNNIATMQHNIMLNAFDNFDGTAAVTMGNYLRMTPEPETNVPLCQPVYGITYCDGDIYGDNSTALSSGRSGGETNVLGYDWLDWHHAQDKAKFDGFDKIDSDYDLITLGFAGDPKEISGGFSQSGGFGGLALAREKNDDVKLTENGGFVGLYRGYHVNGFNITGAADLGVLFSDVKSALGDKDDTTNLWAGIAMNVSYNIMLNETLTLQPGVYGGYTWIHSSGYETTTGTDLDIDNNAHMFEVAPSLRAIASMDNDIYTIATVRYVANFTSGGNITIAGNTITELEMKDYFEYGLSIEKDIERFNMSASIYRHDGGRTGWSGGVQLRYIF